MLLNLRIPLGLVINCKNMTVNDLARTPVMLCNLM
jgi:hypothetical protein